MRVALSVAAYRENLAWLADVPPRFEISVLAPLGCGITGLPQNCRRVILPRDAGRDAYAHLYHIVDNYDDAADYTFFCQGRPGDHVPGFTKCLEAALKPEFLAALDRLGYLGFGKFYDEPFDPRARLSMPWDRIAICCCHPDFPNPRNPGVNAGQVWNHCFGTERYPENLFWHYGAHFGVSLRAMKSRPLAFYRRWMGFVDYTNDPLEAAVIERFWPQVFAARG